MDSLAEVVGLAGVLDRAAVPWRGKNFEALYDRLARSPDCSELVAEIESTVFDYFAALQLPEAASVYDYLLLCLREKDVVATFNWDPFLAQAYQRNSTARRLPQVVFLHGNVAIGVCVRCHVKGYSGDSCGKCGGPFRPTRLLYPVRDKDYTEDLFIAAEWEQLKTSLENAYLLTIFGYGAPSTDAAAVELMRSVWSSNETRELAQVEIIDLKPEADLYRTWEPFITRDHCHTARSLFETWLALHPRRSCDSFAWATLQCDPWRDNRIPCVRSVEELQAWVTPLLEEEERQERDGTSFSGLPCDAIV